MRLCAAAAIAVSAFIACTGSEPNIGGGVDAGNGGDGASGVDANGADDGSNASDGGADADAAKQPGPATFTVIGDGAPRANISVLVTDAVGNAITTLVTDALGKATHVVPVSGVTMTALYGESNVKSALSVVDVMPGDDIVLRYTASAVANPSHEVLITAPPNPPANTVTFRAYAESTNSCVVEAPNNGTGFSLMVNASCMYDGKSSIVLQALDANGVVLGQAWRKALTIEPNSPTIALMSSGWVGLDTFNLNIVAPALTQASIYGGMMPYAANIGLRDYATTKGPTTPDGGTIAVPPSIPPAGMVDAMRYHAVLVYPAAGTTYSRTSITRRSATSFITTIDMKDALPIVSSATLDVTDVTRPKMSWELVGNGAVVMAMQADAVTTAIRWQEGNAYGQWTFYAPASAKSVQIPVLPAALEAWKPKAGVTFEKAGVNFVDSDLTPGYHDFVKNVRAQYVGFYLDAETDDMFANETRRVSSFGEGFVE